MRNREKERIFKRFIGGESVWEISDSRVIKDYHLGSQFLNEKEKVEQAIRDAVKRRIEKKEKE